MGFLDMFKKGGGATQPDSVGSVNGIQLLNLEKGDILDLTKYSDHLEYVRASAGWQINHRGGEDYDLDLCAYLVHKNGKVETVYYGDMHNTGIDLDKDNRTGQKHGDAENIDIRLNKIEKSVTDIYLAVVIYRADEFRQCFEHVENAYVRLVDVNNRDQEICRFNMTEDGGNNTAVLAARLKRNGSSWSFEAIGKYSRDTIPSLGRKLR